MLKSRQDAANAKGAQISTRGLAKSPARIRRGDPLSRKRKFEKLAKKKDILATSLYRDAELIAIKAEYLTETRQLLAKTPTSAESAVMPPLR